MNFLALGTALLLVIPSIAAPPRTGTAFRACCTRLPILMNLATEVEGEDYYATKKSKIKYRNHMYVYLYNAKNFKWDLYTMLSAWNNGNA